MWIHREIESTLAGDVRSWAAVVVTGTRQSGKTSLLTRLFPTAAYVSLDVPAAAREAEESGDAFLRAHPPPAILDEVQYAPAVLRHVKAAIDHRPTARGLFMLTGSQKFQLMQGVAESLAGRALVLECHSLSAREIERHDGAVLEGEALLAAMFRGGYPRLHAEQLPPERFFASYVATYLERDVRQVLQVRSLRDFDRFLRLLALRTGQLVSAHALAAEVGVASTTIRAWMAVLEGSNIIALVPPWHRNIGKRMVKTPKLYFMDTGLACHLVGLRSPAELARSSLVGAVFETFAAGQIVRHFANRGIAPRLMFYRDQQGVEVDFVLAVGERLHLMECKWSEHPSPTVRGFEMLVRLLGEDAILSRTLLTPRRGYYPLTSGVARGDCLSLDHLDPPAH